MVESRQQVTPEHQFSVEQKYTYSGPEHIRTLTHYRNGTQEVITEKISSGQGGTEENPQALVETLNDTQEQFQIFCDLVDIHSLPQDKSLTNGTLSELARQYELDKDFIKAVKPHLTQMVRRHEMRDAFNSIGVTET